jgi:hypothetical protein
MRKVENRAFYCILRSKCLTGLYRILQTPGIIRFSLSIAGIAFAIWGGGVYHITGEM